MVIVKNSGVCIIECPYIATRDFSVAFFRFLKKLVAPYFKARHNRMINPIK